LPTTGDEVLFANGDTGTIKRFMRSRVIGYGDGVGDDDTPVPVTGHVVEMAKPCRQEFVTVITYLPSGFWQVLNMATPADDQRYETDRSLPWYQRHQRLAATLVATALWVLGLISGILIGKMGCG
jgi:hypothetical protein